VMVNFICKLDWTIMSRYLVKHYSRYFCKHVSWMRPTCKLVDSGEVGDLP
jgi:hypothetical protein